MDSTALEASASGSSQPLQPSLPQRYDLPPLKYYTSKEEAIEDLNTLAKTKGYALTIERKNKKGSGSERIYFGCDRREAPKATAFRKGQGEGRNKSSKGTGC